MMNPVLFAVLLCIVIVMYNALSNGNKLSAKHINDPTQDRWIWGYFEESTETPIVRKTPMAERERFNQKTTVPTSTAISPTTTITEAITAEATTDETTTTEVQYLFNIPLTEPLPSYCNEYNGTVPDYRKTGARVAAVKCLEILWALYARRTKEKRFLQCVKYINEKYKIGFAIGGTDAGPGEFPHMGAIGWKGTVGSWVFKCGSSLISEKFVLTAAHCARAPDLDTSIADPVPKIVRLGDRNIIEKKYALTPTDVKISRIIVHPQYKPPKQYYDIALMELEEAVKFTKSIQPACVTSKAEPGTEATLTGWGVVETGSLQISPTLQKATVDIIDSQQCNDLLNSSCNRNWCGIQDHQICAGKLAGGVDACQGDSGGPLQTKLETGIKTQGQMHYVLGIISFGVGCAHPNLPGIYTRVGSFLDWIEDIVWKNDVN